MRPAFLVVVWWPAVAIALSQLSIVQAQSSGDSEGGATAAATNTASKTVVAEALQSLEQTQQAFAKWRQLVEAGAAVDTADYTRANTEMIKLVAHYKSIFINNRRRRESESRPGTRRELPQAWIERMRAVGADAVKKRAETVAELRDALQGDDAGLQYAALQTLQNVGDVEYDKPSMRPLVLPFVKNSKGPTLVAACFALLNTDRRPDDLQLVLDAWQRRSPTLDRQMSRLLFSFSDGKIRGRAEEIILELLASPDAQSRRAALSGLWGASVSDRLAARLIELADDPDSHHAAIYFGLSTLKPKSSAVVDRLIEELADADRNNWGRALWGLGYGVPEDQQAKVAAALADMYVARSDPHTRQKCRELVRQYGGEDAAAALPK